MAAFKDQISAGAVRQLAGVVASVWAEFPTDDFVADAVSGLDELELTGRVDHVADALVAALPGDFTEAAPVVSALAASPDLEGWVSMSVNSAVAKAGLGHPEVALPLLALLTLKFSSEFAVRPFIEGHRDVTLRHLRQWCSSPDEHVRRLVSEGTRPRLPWAPVLRGFVADPSPALDLLEQLVDDESPYVRRSVANHLNDISKDHPDRAVAVAAGWINRPHGPWIVRHGLRTLVKRGHPGALALLGYPVDHGVELVALTLQPDQIRIGDAATIRFTLRAERDTNAVIDYVVHYKGAKARKAGKVFKLTTRVLAAGVPVTIERNHRFEHVSIRRILPGLHRIEVQVNGQVLGGADLDVR